MQNLVFLAFFKMLLKENLGGGGSARSPPLVKEGLINTDNKIIVIT